MKLIIWDFDGTLADTQPLIEAGMDHALKIAGLDPKIKQIWLQHVGLPLQEGARVVFGPMGIEYDLVVKAYHGFNHVEHECLVKGFDGINELLEELRCLKIPMAIASSKNKNPLNRQLKMLGWKHYFDPVVTPNDVQAGKPDPESIYKCLAAHNAKPEDALVIGDTEFDLEMARRANVASLAVCYGFQSMTAMDSYNPIAYVNNTSNLRDVLLAWSKT
jgi:HAD superfamily hydrolase (TIGR01509 family)